MRNMIQLLGGVAVAGVVAAGSSAFTAGSGVTDSVTGKSVVGGALAAAHDVIGADLTAIEYQAATATPNRIKQVDLTLTDEDGSDLPANTTVTAIVTAGGGNASSAAVSCSLKSASTTVFECKDGTNYWTGVTAVSATVDTPDLVIS